MYLPNPALHALSIVFVEVSMHSLNGMFTSQGEKDIE